MNTCGACKYFTAGELSEHPGVIPESFHYCGRMEYISGIDGDISDESAVVVDGSGFFAALCVKEDFGCNQWKSAEAEKQT
jgi:hypothetical protein